MNKEKAMCYGNFYNSISLACKNANGLDAERAYAQTSIASANGQYEVMLNKGWEREGGLVYSVLKHTTKEVSNDS